MRHFMAILLLFGLFGILKSEAVADRNLTSAPQFKAVNGSSSLHVWYFDGEQVQPFDLWKTVQVDIKFTGNVDAEYSVYQDTNKTELLKAYELNQRFLTNFFRKWSSTWRPSTYLNPFQSTYIGIETGTSYSIALKYKNLDFMLVLLFVAGVVLYLGAKRLSRSSFAFYSGGTTLGIFGSLLILIFLLYRLTPKRSMAVSIIVGGWSFAAYVGYVLWSNLYVVLSDYYRFVAVYFVSVAIISFAVAYLRGPPKDSRTLHLIQWALQLIGFLMIYYGSQIPSLSVATILALVVFNNLPSFCQRPFRWIRYRFFPKKRRLLTEDEYISEGVKATKEALDNLRKFCKSPDCDTWRTVSRLQSPKRFGAFVDGIQSHISDEEILRYSHESEIDERDSDDDDEESENDSAEIDRSTINRSLIDRSDRSSQTPDNRLSTATYELRRRDDNGRSRYYESFNGGLPNSAPGKSLIGNGSSRFNRTFNGR